MSNSRHRFVRHQWVRDDAGDWLPLPPPSGTRTPNRIIWGHSPDDFFQIARKPGLNVITVWSRSMIMEFGKDHPEEIAPHIYEEELACGPKPRLRKPWPVLKVRKDVKVDAPLDAIDEGSDHEEDGAYEVLQSSWDAEDERGPKGFEELEKDAGDPFNLEGIPKLEQFIPEEYFPDYILVHDPQDVCSGRPPRHIQTKGSATEEASEPKRYKRVFPTDEMLRSKKSKDEDRPNVAHLYVNKKGEMGEGHHSMAYRASVRLPYPLSAHSPNKQVTVAMKVAMQRQSARDMLENEAETYNTFPRHLMEDWCGYNLPTPEHAFPVPATAVVPKFFGYYKPDFGTDDDDEEEASEKSDDEGYHGDWDIDWKFQRRKTRTRDSAVKKPSPILLMEDCGVPINPKDYDLDTRTEIFSMALRLHFEGIVQNSFFTRNIVMQPGPLTLPPEKRSIDRPSFRVIDFGRAELWADLHKAAVGNMVLKNLKKDTKDSDKDKVVQEILRGESTEVEKVLDGLGRSWWEKRTEEKNQARSELGMNKMA
ncbi:hypothetical protein DENSPDRAFT_842457 [Dentipellis sp. KUC8613]|nr:hypothetical protein DENSPDRAFT_842457 [Dentipellis sp. KUC8613]